MDSRKTTSSSKYADLPGIDTESPDVFETPDKKISNGVESPAQNEFESDEIENIALDRQSAFGEFKGKYLESDNADFSDRIGIPKNRGYETRSEFEILGDRSATKETPGQRYQRLQHEIKQLSDDLEEMKSSSKIEEEKSKLSSVTLSNEVKKLQQQLESWQLETIIGSEFSTGPSIPQGTVNKKLQHQLESFKNVAKSKSGDKTQGKEECITYELMYKPENVKLAQLSKVSELEERVKKLEGVLGSNSPQLSTIFDQSSQDERSLTVSVANIQEKLAILDTTHVEHIDARLQGVLHHLNQLSSKKEDMENVEKEKQITELYDLVTKWDTTADVVPELIGRLETLKSLHEQANQFGSSLTHLDTTQRAISDQMQNQQKLLNEVTKNFEANIALIGENCSKLETRINNLTTKAN